MLALVIARICPATPKPLLGVVEAHNIERLLRYLGEPLEPPRRAPARDPPYFKYQVLRRKFGELN